MPATVGKTHAGGRERKMATATQPGLPGRKVSIPNKDTG